MPHANTITSIVNHNFHNPLKMNGTHKEQILSCRISWIHELRRYSYFLPIRYGLRLQREN